MIQEHQPTPTMALRRKHLLVTRIGPKSLHSAWLNDARSFDVLLSAYDPTTTKVEAPNVEFEYRIGKKVEGYSSLIADKGDLILNYDYILFLDEDIETDSLNVNKIFYLCEIHKLKIAQPALTWDSYFTYGALLQQPNFTLRHVNFIEMMCPVFSRDTLERISPIFSMGYESGIDLVWCNLVFEKETDFAVLDSAPVRHTEPVGGNKSANGFDGSKTYEDHIYSILGIFSLPWLSCVPYSAITLSGRKVSARPLLFLNTLNILGAVLQRRPWRPRLRSILVHLRHIIVRSARNVRIEAPSFQIFPK